MREIVMKEGEVKKLVISHLKGKGYNVVKAGHPLPIGCWRRSPDIFARKDGRRLVVECKGGPERTFYSVINALGQVLAIKAHYPDYDAVIAVPSNWGEDCLSERIRETYSIKLWLANTILQTVSEL